MTASPTCRLRRLHSDDVVTVEAVLELNDRWVPHVGPLTRERLVRILDAAAFAVVAESAAASSVLPRLAGFIVALGPGADYDSPNYRWFETRLDEGRAPGAFRYVDRIAVSPDVQGTGVGRCLYEATFADASVAGAAEVTCEVNLDPPNPDSQAFHTRMAFGEVGRQWTYDHTVEVQLLARRL